jgi:hypothetical protein
MTIPSEYIQIFGAVIYATALFYTIQHFGAQKDDHITLSYNIFNEL